MSNDEVWASIAEMFAAVAVPKVTEGGGLFGKKYIRLGPLYVTVMGWMFQKTRSLSLVAITHGCVNIFLFGVIPHLGLGLGLF